MAKKTAPILPATANRLLRFGERLRLARLRRRLPAKQVAERSGMSPMTLRSLESGGSGVTIGAYLAVMQVLGIEKDIDLLGQADPVGRELQDAQLPMHANRARSTKARKTAKAQPTSKTIAVVPDAKSQESPQSANGWIQNGDFASSDALAGLIVPPKAPNKKAH